MHGYSSVWQTWDILQPNSQPQCATHENDVAESDGTSTLSQRQSMQKRRIELRLSIPLLAERIKCDASVLAAFERGDDILQNDTYMALKKELKL